MRRLLLFTVVLSVLLSFTACSQQDAPGGDLFGEPTDTVLPNKWILDKSVPMFFCQDNYDIEGDPYTVYQYNCDGELLSSSTSSCIAYYAENGLCCAEDPVTKKYGFVNKKGMFVIPPVYEIASAFSPKGLARVAKYKNDNLKFGFIDSTGVEVIPCQYELTTSFWPSGFAAFGEIVYGGDNTKDILYGVINEKGEVIIQPTYKQVVWIGENYLVVILESGQEAIVDFSGNFLDVLDRVIEIDGKKYGQLYQIMPSGIYRNTFDKGAFLPWLLVKQEVFDGQKFVEQEAEYEITHKSMENMVGGVAFGVTENGETVIPFQYDAIFRVRSYFVGIRFDSDDNSQIIDIYNSSYQKTAENLKYEFLFPWYYEQDLPDGYFCVYRANALRGIIDYTGRVIVEPVFGRGLWLNSYFNAGEFPRDYWDMRIPGFQKYMIIYEFYK